MHVSSFGSLSLKIYLQQEHCIFELNSYKQCSIFGNIVLICISVVWGGMVPDNPADIHSYAKWPLEHPHILREKTLLRPV